MSEDLLLADLRRASTWPHALLRVANDSGEHFFAGYKQLGAYGLPHQPRVHLSISPGGQRVIWQRGNGNELFMHLLDWATTRPYRVRFEYARQVDERGDVPDCQITIFEVDVVAQAQARDPLSALLRALALADQAPAQSVPRDGSYGVWSGFKS